VKQIGQELGRELCGNIQILIVSAVKTCKQCLQTTSAPRLHWGLQSSRPSER